MDLGVFENSAAMSEKWNLSLGEAFRTLDFHFRICKGASETEVSRMLSEGADPELRDEQNLSAIDHAILTGNREALTTILAFVIGNEMRDVQESMQSATTVTHFQEVRRRIKRITSIDVEQLTPLNRAAYEGNIEKLSEILETVGQEKYKLDAKNRNPIHYAILGNQPAAVEKLIEAGEYLHRFDRDGNHLLHYAVAMGSKELISQLIELGADINATNFYGETPLHYACADERLELVEYLIKCGADLRMRDDSDSSPLTLIGMSAYERDPLNLSKIQLITFAALSTSFILMLAKNDEWITADQRSQFDFLTALGAGVAAYWSDFYAVIHNREWKKIAAGIALSGLQAIKPIRFGCSVLSLSHTVYRAFEEINLCQKAISRTFKKSRNILFHSATTLFALTSIEDLCQTAFRSLYSE